MSGINVAALIAAVLIYTTVFAWNAAAIASFKHTFPNRHRNDAIKNTTIYALLVTIFIIAILYLLNQTNKIYYIYTGLELFNFTGFNDGVTSRKSVLSFWDDNPPPT
jgi:TRAP-type C4-dicarboxylate transport system permease small subunit